MLAYQHWSTNTWNQHLSTNDWLPTFDYQHWSINIWTTFQYLASFRYQHLRSNCKGTDHLLCWRVNSPQHEAMSDIPMCAVHLFAWPWHWTFFNYPSVVAIRAKDPWSGRTAHDCLHIVMWKWFTKNPFWMSECVSCRHFGRPWRHVAWCTQSSCSIWRPSKEQEAFQDLGLVCFPSLT